jgi:hypothetical protein
MMNATNPSLPPPVPSAAEVENLLVVLRVISDPKASAARIKEFADAAAAARKAIDQAAADRKAVENLKSNTAIALDELKRRHAERLSAELEAHQAAFTRRGEDIDRREVAVAARESAVASAEDRVGKLEASIKHKLAVLAA